MSEAPTVWKFQVVIPVSGKGPMPRAILVPASDPLKAHAILIKEHPNAEVAQGYAVASEEELHASGGAFLQEEPTRVINP